MTLRPAFPELLALACASRPDWGFEETRDAMMAAKNAGWPWESVFREVIRLIVAEDETPATLRNSARRPMRPRAATGTPDQREGPGTGPGAVREPPGSQAGSRGNRPGRNHLK